MKEIGEIGTKKDRRRIVARISAVAGEPRPPGCEKLAGSDIRYLIRHGNYRVVYAVDDHAQEVEVIKVGHRGDVCRTV
jgi:mRNA interferase RelE/StbE